MSKIYTSVAIFLMVSQNAMAQDRRPGIPGEDAPGGQVVRILSDDIEMHGVLYYPDEMRSMNFYGKKSENKFQ